MTDANKIIEIKPSDSLSVVTPMTMIEKALVSGAAPETLEKLMALQERYEANMARKAFDDAMAEAKSKIGPVIKNREVDFTSAKGRTNYRYEDFSAVAATVDPVLTEHGLSYRFRTSQDAGKLTVTCIMSHRMGHREETTLQAGNDESGNKNHIQSVGSAATYLQRYTLKLALGLAVTNDTDGKTETPEMVMSITAEQFQELQALLEESKSAEAEMLDYVKAKDVESMTLAQYAKAKAAMVQKISLKKKAAK